MLATAAICLGKEEDLGPIEPGKLAVLSTPQSISTILEKPRQYSNTIDRLIGRNWTYRPKKLISFNKSVTRMGDSK